MTLKSSSVEYAWIITISVYKEKCIQGQDKTTQPHINTKCTNVKNRAQLVKYLEIKSDWQYSFSYDICATWHWGKNEYVSFSGF